MEADDNSLVFKVDEAGDQIGPPFFPVRVINNANKINLLSGIYLQDTWQLTEKLRANFGVRWDRLSGFTYNNQIDPTINLVYVPRRDTTFHGGFARYMQVPSFQGISPGAPAAFAGTTGLAGTGTVTPETEDDYEWDGGIVHQLTKHITVSEDDFYEYTHHYLDTGQFGVVPIFAPFNYKHGYIWGTETAITYNAEDLSIHGSTTIGRNMQKGVATGQFNFDPDELGYINRHYIVLDHQPLYGASGGINYTWRRFAFSIDALYSSGLRGGFADLESLPHVVQVDLSAQSGFRGSASRRNNRSDHVVEHLRPHQFDSTCRGYRHFSGRVRSEDHGLRYVDDSAPRVEPIAGTIGSAGGSFTPPNPSPVTPHSLVLFLALLWF